MPEREFSEITDEYLAFAGESDTFITPPEFWKVMIVDDEAAVHEVTKLAIGQLGGVDHPCDRGAGCHPGEDSNFEPHSSESHSNATSERLLSWLAAWRP